MAAPAHIARANGMKGGRPKGTKNPATLEREAVLKALQQNVMNASRLLFDKILHNALGHSYLFKIEKYYETVPNKKGAPTKVLRRKPPQLVTSEYEIRDYLQKLVDDIDFGNNDLEDPADTYYYITTEKPSTHAIEALWNRTFGKSVQPVAITDPHGNSVFDYESKKKSDKAIKHLLSKK